MTLEKMKACIDACLNCAIECARCATECLGENDVVMHLRCVQLCRECVIISNTTAQLMGIGGEHATACCHVCAEICEVCAEECEKHASHGTDHCKRCAEACRRCADECRTVTGVNA